MKFNLLSELVSPLPPAAMAKIKETFGNKYWQSCREGGMDVHSLLDLENNLTTLEISVEILKKLKLNLPMT